MRKRITRIKLNIFFELKGLKIYWMQILISLFILPLSFLFILLLSGVSTSEMLSFWLSGFIVASLVGAFLGALALRVCNLMQPEILELYATLDVNRIEIVLNLALTYSILVLPQLVIASTIAGFNALEFHAWGFVLAILVVMVSLIVFSIAAGLAVRNYYQALGIFPFVSWIIILLSPAYYDMRNLNIIFQDFLLINPLTHYLNWIRSQLGSQATVPLYISIIYISLFLFFLLVFLARKLKGIYILERI